MKIKSSSNEPLRGEIWLLDLSPTIGHEQSALRPALVISEDIFNSGPAGLVITCPITSKNRQIRAHLEVLPPEGGLAMPSYIMTEQVRTVSKNRLIRKTGRVSVATMEEVEDKLRIIVGL